MKNGFFTPQSEDSDVRTFVAQANRRSPHKQVSIATIGVSSDGTKVCLLKPRKVSDAQIRVPPQGRVQERYGDIFREASRLVRDRVSIRVPSSDVSYIGYGFARNYKSNQDYGKLVHWTCASFGDTGTGGAGYKFDPTDYAGAIEWWPIAGLFDYSKGMMSQRKAWLFQQAIMAMPSDIKTFKAEQFQDMAIL